MHRLPNPPKLPVIGMAETRSRGGKTAKARVWMFGLALLAACGSSGGPVLANEGATSVALETTAEPDAAGNIVVHGISQSRGEIIRNHAEKIRREAFSTLLGETHPKPWLVRCEIHVHASSEAFADAVGGPPAEARGATSLEFSGDRVITRRIDVMGDGPATVPDAIDHELVHVVLADHFVHAAPPRWADEGLALLFDTPEKQHGHDADFQEAHRRGLAWTASELVAMEEYPVETSRQRVFYGQSAALVRWLMAEQGAATFIRFVDDSSTIGFSAALQDHYGLDAVADLEPAWRQGIPLEELVSTAGPLR